MKREQYPVPRWTVCAAGSGGTSATLGRYRRYCQYDTELCVADPENSVFFDSWRQKRRDLTQEKASRIEGIGCPHCEPSFIAGVVDHMLKMPDAASIAAVRVLEELLGRRCGGSTGTQFIAALLLTCNMRARVEKGCVVTLICDRGDRYTQTCYSDTWIQSQLLNVTQWRERIYNTLQSGDYLLSE